MARALRGLSSNTTQRGLGQISPVPPSAGLKSSVLKQAALGIQYNPSIQQQTNLSPQRFQSERRNSLQFRDRAASTRQWGTSMHDRVMDGIQRKKDLAAATKLANQANQIGLNDPPVATGQPASGRASDLRASVGISPNGSQKGGITPFRAEIIERARKYLGTPYTLGGGHQRNATTPSRGYNGIYGLDCSGLTGIVYRQMGINLPGIANQQSVFGKRTNIKYARPGDLVGWNKGGHIAIYIGNGKILHAPRPGEVVQIRNLFRGEKVFAVQLTLPGD